MNKSNIAKIIKKSIKPFSAVIFILVIVSLFILISSVNNQFELKVAEQEKYGLFIEKDIKSRILNKRKSLEQIQNISAIEKAIFNLNTSFSHEEANVDQLKQCVQHLFSSDVTVEKITIGNLILGSRLSIAINDLDEKTDLDLPELKASKDLWIKDDYGYYNVRYFETSVGEVKLLIYTPIQLENASGWYSSLQIDIESLFDNYSEKLPERFALVTVDGEYVYSGDSGDKESIKEIIKLYGENVFFDSSGINRNKREININDLKYFDGKIITTNQLSNDLILVVFQDYKKFSFISIKDQLIVTLFVFSVYVFGIVGVVIHSSYKTEAWINLEKQSLNEVVNIDKMQITYLQNELKFYQELIYETKTPMVMIDRETSKIFMINQAATKFYEYSEDKMLGLSFKDICILDFEYDLSNESVSIVHLKSDHSSEERRVRFQEIFFGNSDILVMSLLSKSLMTNEDFLEVRTKLFHEIRNPLQGAYGANEMIEKATDNYGEYTSMIKRSITNVLEITDNVLAREKISHENEKVQITQFNLVELAKDVIETIMFQDTNYNQIAGSVFINKNEILTKLDDYMVKTDIVKLRHVLINLLSNGSRYTNAGLVTLNIEVEKQDDYNLINFKVSDTGKGLSEGEIQEMYEKLTLFGAKKKNVASFGIGLDVAKKYVELLGSELKVHSELDLGSIFSFSLRLEACDLEVKKISDSKTILVVDDDEISCESLKQFFEKEMNYRVNTLTNETLIFNELNHFEYDCVLIDQKLNHFNGVDIIKLIRASINKRIANMPIILMQAGHSKDKTKKLIDAEISDIVLKPFNNDEMVKVIERLLDNKSENFEQIIVYDDIDIDIVDYESLLETIDIIGISVFFEMVGKFDLSSRVDIAELDKLILERSYEKIGAIVHRLKGSMLYFAPVKSKKIIIEMEKMENDKKYSDFLELYEMFKDAHVMLIEELNKVCKKLA